MTYCVCMLNFIWPVSSQSGSNMNALRCVACIGTQLAEDAGVATFGSDQVNNVYFISPEAEPLECLTSGSFSFDLSHTVRQFCLHLNFSFRSTMQLRALQQFFVSQSVAVRGAETFKMVYSSPWCWNIQTRSLIFSVAAARRAGVISAEQQQFCHQKFRRRTHLETEIFSGSPLKGTQLSIKTF